MSQRTEAHSIIRYLLFMTDSRHSRERSATAASAGTFPMWRLGFSLSDSSHVATRPRGTSRLLDAAKGLFSGCRLAQQRGATGGVPRCKPAPSSCSTASPQSRGASFRTLAPRAASSRLPAPQRASATLASATPAWRASIWVNTPIAQVRRKDSVYPSKCSVSFDGFVCRTTRFRLDILHSSAVQVQPRLVTPHRAEEAPNELLHHISCKG